MSLVWLDPPKPSSRDLATYLEHLHPLGVRWGQWPGDQPDVTYSFTSGRLMAEIGGLTVVTGTGVITVWPYAGIGLREAMTLATCGELAFTRKPSAATGWIYVRRGNRRWSSRILVEVSTDDGIAALVARKQRSMEWEGLRALKDVSQLEVAE